MVLLIAMEMIMTHLEFWTMALLTIPLLAFGVMPYLKFLSEKSIGAMFNLGIKMMCISSLSGVVFSTLTSYVRKVAEADKEDSGKHVHSATPRQSAKKQDSLCILMPYSCFITGGGLALCR